MSATCDCLNVCGDDTDVQTGKVKPCPHLQALLDRPKLSTIAHVRGSKDSVKLTFDKPVSAEDLKRIEGILKLNEVKLLGF